MQSYADNANVLEVSQRQGELLKAKYKPNEYTVRKIFGILSGAIPVPVSYNDGDQSPLTIEKDEFVRVLWAEGLDYNPDNPRLVYHSDWMRTIYRGDYEGFLEMIKDKNDEELQRMLARRETLMNVSAVFHVITGARKYGSSTQANHGHMRILIKLISLGVDVNVRDFAGFTPLHHCVTKYGNGVTFKMAERLIRAGAEVDAKHRFGGTPLYEVCVTKHYEAVELLLKHGADPLVMDNDGWCPNVITKWNPRIQALFGKYYIKNMKEQRMSPDHESQSKCNVCKKEEATNKRCTGCYIVWYCGYKCQKQDWAIHMALCQKTRSSYKIGRYNGETTVQTYSGMYGASTSVTPPKDKKLQKHHFNVKIQVLLCTWPRLFDVDTSDADLYIYNEDKSFNISLPKLGNEELHRQLYSKIKSEGYHGMKGYFHVIMEPGDQKANQFRINPENIFVEPW